MGSVPAYGQAAIRSHELEQLIDTNTARDGSESADDGSVRGDDFATRFQWEVDNVSAFFVWKRGQLEAATAAVSKMVTVSPSSLERKTLLSSLSELRKRLVSLHEFAMDSCTGLRRILSKQGTIVSPGTSKAHLSAKLAGAPFSSTSTLEEILQSIDILTSTLQSPVGTFQRFSEDIETALASDDVLALDKVSPLPLSVSLNRSILFAALAKPAPQCYQRLLAALPNHALTSFVNIPSLLHVAVETATSSRNESGNENLDDPTPVESTLQGVSLVKVGELLLARDPSGRTPLHIASSRGSIRVASSLIRAIKSSSAISGDSKSLSGAAWKDDDGWTPLHVAVMGRHVDLVKMLLDGFSRGDVDTRVAASSEIETKLSAVGYTPLLLACLQTDNDMVQLLLDYGADPDLVGPQGEGPLHVASFTNSANILETLLSASRKPNVNLRSTAGCTPLHLASMDGGTECVNLLLVNGADVSMESRDGYNAFEHALYAGHFATAVVQRPSAPSFTAPSAPHATPRGYPTQPIPSLTSKSAIFITLGSLDNRRKTRPVDIYGPAGLVPHDVTVMGDGADGETVVVPHTIQSAETARSPITLHAEDPSDVTLQFSIRPGFGQRGGIVGTAVAVLSSPGSSPWQERVPRGGSLTSPIVDLRGRVVGKVAFDFVVVDPWRRPEGLKVRDVPQLWKPLSAGIVGHRGLGMNRAVRELQLGENTIISFSTAGSLGAEFVEFDVQLTKDHKPVLYHDWSVTETGIDIAINQLSLEQFLALKPRTRPSAATTNGSGWNGKRRGSSDVNVFREKVEVEPKKHQHGLKGNSDGSVQGEFAKLEGAFKSVDIGVGFNIEVKYPNPEEATMYDLHLAELNLYVDTILSCVFKHAGERRIIFSSFQPEACRMLRLKQSVYPVLFLTESGTYASADPRCNAMSTAVEFARSTGLDGIVTVADPVVEAPRLIGRARGKGLLVFTYGGLNNVVENVKLQRRFGADAVILDSLVRIRRGLAQENPHTALEASAEKRGVGWEI